MTTVASRVVRSSPHRNTSDTWAFIVDLLTQGKDSDARKELLSVAGIASSVIAERGPGDAAILVTCEGPRTRVYCIYDDAAIEGGDAKEDDLGYDPLKGHWVISLPCPEEDLEWIQRALKAKSIRITARDMTQILGEEAEAGKSAASGGLTLNVDKFLKS
ncbi:MULTISPECIES: hypothetical protein [unclassified Roseateles]|uniref:hypothetical protein n=1 Tax=unclassified Roseateles TaxID=2626991 RepID=UPI0006FE9CFB|nr:MULTISPECIES: hypothetical protein [unclassified Roseateles]KQW43306.1 hypothetical protein ASC81_16050 [Pelomonas sp. Root405]KRA71044.1 hypothetical protein ASD88_14575 [Pelomonas sp. Root662]